MAPMFPNSKHHVKQKVSNLGNDFGFRSGYFFNMNGIDRSGNGHAPDPPWRLKEWRLIRRLSQEKLAFKMRTTKATICKLERYQIYGPGNGRQKLTDELRVRYCAALEVTTQELLTLPGTRPAQLAELLEQQRRTTAMIEDFVKS